MTVFHARTRPRAAGQLGGPCDGPWSRRIRRLFGGIVVLVGSTGYTTGCKLPSALDEPEMDAVQRLETSAERGPVRMTVTVDKNRVTIAETWTLEIEVEADEGVDVIIHPLSHSLADLEIRDSQARNEEPSETGRRWTQSYELEAFRSGEYEIPAVTVAFVDRRHAQTAANGIEQGVIEGELTTEPLTVSVISLLTGEFDPTQFRDVKGPVELTVSATYPGAWWAGGGGGALLLLIVATVLFLRWRRRSVRVVVRPPHEWALDELGKLNDDQLVEKGQIEAFYVRLSTIVRVYLELRFALMAPERTTEEFLAEAQSSHALTVEQRALLGGFLEASDMVKFARHHPAPEEIDNAFDSAGEFVRQTVPTSDSGDRWSVEAAA